MKADAILSKGAAVFSVPRFRSGMPASFPLSSTPTYEAKAVVIVPDADWFEKTEVISQARLCQAALKTAGRARSTHRRAPVDSEGNPLVGAHGKEPKRRGRFSWRRWPTRRSRTVDYYLPRATQVAISGPRYPALHRQDQRIRNREVLSALAMFAGRSARSLVARVIAKVMNRSRSAVSAAIRQLEVWGALTVEGDLDARRDYWRGWLEWNEAPVIVLADEFPRCGAFRPPQ